MWVIGPYFESGLFCGRGWVEHYSGSAGVGGGVWDIILSELGKLGWVEHYFG